VHEKHAEEQGNYSHTFRNPMSAKVSDAAINAVKTTTPPHRDREVIAAAPKDANYKGFVAGVFSGITKLTVG
jgi:solute carrier family 25 carnitine/acylcarnitine transporter 20/29